MKPRIAIALLALVLLSDFAFASTNGDTTTDTINKMYADLRLAIETSDLSRYSKYLHADASLRPPGADGINGKKNYLSLMAMAFASANHHITIKKSPEVTMLGDTALVEYVYTIQRSTIDPTISLAEGSFTQQETTADYLDVLIRDNDGNWRIRLHKWAVID
jgi:ketosteroid isomerase-like protein